MFPSSWFTNLSQIRSSYLVLITLVLLTLVAGLFFYLGLFNWVFRVIGVLAKLSANRSLARWLISAFGQSR